jgi:hypothetical protein
VTPGRLELPTNSLGNCCSIHLSYGATLLSYTYASAKRIQDAVGLLALLSQAAQSEVAPRKTSTGCE